MGTARGRGKGAAGTRRPRKYFTASVEDIMELARSGKSQQVRLLGLSCIIHSASLPGARLISCQGPVLAGRSAPESSGLPLLQEVADHFGVTKSTIGKKVRGSGLAWPKKKSSKSGMTAVILPCSAPRSTITLLTVLHSMQTIPGAASKREEAAVVRCLQSQQGDVSQTCWGVPDRVTR